MSKCSKERPSSDHPAIKFGMREYNRDNNCPMRNQVLKQLPQEVTDPIPESILEEVSDDLVLLRCRLCESNMPDLAAFVPEPWFDSGIIMERLSEIANGVDRYLEPGPCRGSLQGLIARIGLTIEEA